VRDPGGARALNVDFPERLARWCRAEGVRLLHVSTDLVFGAELPPEDGFDEDASPGPLGVYGETKSEGESRVLGAHPDALIVRLPLLYGNSGGRGLGASDDLLEAVDRDGEGQELPGLFIDEWRTPIEVSHAAGVLIELLHGKARGLLHVAGPDRVSRHELGLAVLEAMGLSPADALAAVRAIRIDQAPELGPRPRDVSLDARRARALLGREVLGLGEGLRAAMR
jgi:dTDP-4-dehydrorhamnose reductase